MTQLSPSVPRASRAPRGSRLTARSWLTKAPLCMLMNNLDPEVAERPEDLVAYGGIGKAARNWDCFDAIEVEGAAAPAPLPLPPQPASAARLPAPMKAMSASIMAKLEVTVPQRAGLERPRPSFRQVDR